MKHINVALFVPDEGCPHRCSFCNQKTISGFTRKLSSSDVDDAVKTAIDSGKDFSDGEIAFFGGSFTAIERNYMLDLLSSAYKYVNKGIFKGIRISTRPDCIDEHILQILKEYGVTSIELGCQSMDDEVLLLNNRGHESSAVIRACNLIKEFNFELGVQMMTGLYGDSDEKAIETAKRLISLNPATARIYPTIVLENTELSRLYVSGLYKPQTLDEAVGLCSKLLLMFENAGVKVIRLGLHSGGNVEEGYIAGAFHPAFRELCENKIFFNKLCDYFKDKTPGDYIITVSPKSVSKLAGQKKCNIEYFNQKGYYIKIKTDENYNKYYFTIQGRTR